jgi:putative transposase
MSKYRRWRVEGGTYFFTVVTYERQPILTSDLARRSLRTAINEIRRRHPFEIVAFVLLPEHLHTVWQLPRGDVDYSVRWRQIKTRFTQLYSQENRDLPSLSESRTKRHEHSIWQRRFYEHTVRDESDLKRCVDYIHINPVKHRLVSRVGDWEWSSFHRFVVEQEYDHDWGGSDEWFGDEFQQWE